jgi:hypothetical protein
VKVVVPPSGPTGWLSGVTESTAAPGACVTVTVLGLAAAPAAVTVIVPLRSLVVVFAVKVAVSVSSPVPEALSIVSQVSAAATDAVHCNVPHPVLRTSNAVLPPEAPTLRLSGVTKSAGAWLPACVTVTVFGFSEAPEAANVTLQVRASQFAFA